MEARRTWNEISQLLESSYDRLERALNQFPWEDRNSYALLLSQLYFYTRHISRALALAAARTPKSNPLHGAFVQGIMEEGEHDQMALADLRRLGFGIENFRELPSTSAYYQTLFYSIEFLDPSSLMGYSLLLEGFAGSRLAKVVHRLEQAYSKETTTFIRTHCLLDVEHAQQAEQFIRTFSPEKLAHVYSAIERSCYLYEQLVLGVAQASHGEFEKLNIQAAV